MSATWWLQRGPRKAVDRVRLGWCRERKRCSPHHHGQKRTDHFDFSENCEIEHANTCYKSRNSEDGLVRSAMIHLQGSFLVVSLSDLTSCATITITIILIIYWRTVGRGGPTLNFESVLGSLASSPGKAPICSTLLSSLASSSHLSSIFACNHSAASLSKTR